MTGTRRPYVMLRFYPRLIPTVSRKYGTLFVGLPFVEVIVGRATTTEVVEFIAPELFGGKRDQ